MKKKNEKHTNHALLVRKNDTVLILSGENGGKSEKGLKVYPKQNRLIVEGINFGKRHTKATQKKPKGGIVEKEGPVNASNVMVVCGKCGQPTRIGTKIMKDGERIRMCKKCGEMIEAA